MSAMLRGEVWWVNFDPSVGGEIRKQRPAIILSNDTANTYFNRVQVVPLTSNVGRLYPSEALVTLQGQQSKAMADQLTTVSKMRFISRIGRVSARDMQQVERRWGCNWACQVPRTMRPRPEAAHFLVRSRPAYRGRRIRLLMRWHAALRTAETMLRTPPRQAGLRDHAPGAVGGGVSWHSHRHYQAPTRPGEGNPIAPQRQHARLRHTEGRHMGCPTIGPCGSSGLARHGGLLRHAWRVTVMIAVRKACLATVA